MTDVFVLTMGLPLASDFDSERQIGQIMNYDKEKKNVSILAHLLICMRHQTNTFRYVAFILNELGILFLLNNETFQVQ